MAKLILLDRHFFLRLLMGAGPKLCRPIDIYTLKHPYTFSCSIQSIPMKTSPNTDVIMKYVYINMSAIFLEVLTTNKNIIIMGIIWEFELKCNSFFSCLSRFYIWRVRYRGQGVTSTKI